MPPPSPPTAIDHRSLAESLIDDGGWDDFTAGFNDADYAALLHDWTVWRRPAQTTPPGMGTSASIWYIRAGRGFGKTRTGSETVRQVIEWAPLIAVVAPTAGDVRDIMVEGESGIMSVFPRSQRPDYEPSKRRITFHNGARATTFSADEPERLRGPQYYWGWFDEPASMRRGQEAWDNFEFGLRLGTTPWALLTGTPKPFAWIRALDEEPTTVTTTGSTYENVGNLSAVFLRRVVQRYEGTRRGRQELHAEYLDDVEGALWTWQGIDDNRIAGWDGTGPWASQVPWVTMVGVDPPGETAECGIVVGTAPKRGRAGEHHAVILDDLSLAGPPEVWGAQVVTAFRRHHADGVIVEANQGGDMVRSTIHNVDSSVPVTKVRASQSKYDRAEPISALYGKGWVHHAAYFGELETQLTTWVPSETKSPDRLDALVHLITSLLAPMPTVRATAHSPLGRRIAS